MAHLKKDYKLLNRHSFSLKSANHLPPFRFSDSCISSKVIWFLTNEVFASLKHIHLSKIIALNNIKIYLFTIFISGQMTQKPLVVVLAPTRELAIQVWFFWLASKKQKYDIFFGLKTRNEVCYTFGS